MSEGHRGRLWEKLMQQGLRNGFHHPYEKLELMLTCIIPRKDTKDLAKRLMARFGTLNGVIRAPAHELYAVEGVGKRTAHFLRLFGEVALVLAEEDLHHDAAFDGPEGLKAYLMAELGWEESEYFMALFLDGQNRLLHKLRLFRGTVNRSQIYPREVVKEALVANAVSCVVAHNHPSGTLKPSAADHKVTKAVGEGLQTVGIRLLDHFIVTRGKILSMHEQGLFDFQR